MTQMQDELRAVRSGYTDFKAFARHWVELASRAPQRPRSTSPLDVLNRAEESDLYMAGDWSEIRSLRSLGLLSQAEYDYMRSLAEG